MAGGREGGWLIPMPKRPAPVVKPRCTVCHHKERHRIEMLRVAAGATFESLAAQFQLGRWAIMRHMANHVSADTKSALMADVPLRELADRAAAEDVSLLDHLMLIRRTVMGQMIGAAAVNDRTGTALLAGKALEVVKETGKFTGELLRSAPLQHITNNNVAVFMSSPTYSRLERMLLERLAPHPEALRAVVEGLEQLEGEQEGDALLALPAAGGFHAAA